MDYSAGVDVSLRSVGIVMIDSDGKHVFERSMACEIEDIGTCLSDVSQGLCGIGFESSAMSQHLHFGLQSAGSDVVCTEERQVNATLSAMRKKFNKTDIPFLSGVCPLFFSARNWLGWLRRDGALIAQIFGVLSKCPSSLKLSHHS